MRKVLYPKGPPPRTHPRHEVDTFDRLVAGDMVTIIGGSTLYRFTSATLDDTTGEVLWVNLFGPISKAKSPPVPKIKSVKSDRVKIPSKRSLTFQRNARAEQGRK